MRYLIPAGFLIAGIIHLLPVSGVLGAERLRTLYGVEIAGPDLAILMRHRAVMFGLLGLLLVAATFLPGLRWVGLIGGLGSAVAFLAIALATGDYNDAMRRVVVADIVAIAALAAAGLAMIATG